MADWSREIDLLLRAGIHLEPGLSGAELGAVEERHGLRFPPDLRELLRVALPISDLMPTWRDPESPAIHSALAWPFEGIQFDIEHNAF